jgi:hypothetical protein
MSLKSVKSFQVKINKNMDIIKNDKLLDGTCVFVTNHTKHHSRGFKVKPQAFIDAYRDKIKIEDVFKSIKSFLKLRTSPRSYEKISFSFLAKWRE